MRDGGRILCETKRKECNSLVSQMFACKRHLLAFQPAERSTRLWLRSRAGSSWLTEDSDRVVCRTFGIKKNIKNTGANISRLEKN